MVYKCSRCGAENAIVNQCGCDPNNLPTTVPASNTLTLDELTERFYLVRGQRNKLLWACEKALAAFDAAHQGGKSTWAGKDVDEMRAAVADCKATGPAV